MELHRCQHSKLLDFLTTRGCGVLPSMMSVRESSWADKVCVVRILIHSFLFCRPLSSRCTRLCRLLLSGTLSSLDCNQQSRRELGFYLMLLSGPKDVQRCVCVCVFSNITHPKVSVREEDFLEVPRW